MNKNNLHKLECRHCYSIICNICDLQGDDYHYNQPCLGYLKTHMDEETIAYLQALGMQMCPGCKTGVLKTEYCDHMTCLTPGCGAHFCYRCGATISSLGMYTHQCPILQQAIGINQLEAQAAAAALAAEEEAALAAEAAQAVLAAEAVQADDADDAQEAS